MSVCEGWKETQDGYCPCLLPYEWGCRVYPDGDGSECPYIPILKVLVEAEEVRGCDHYGAVNCKKPEDLKQRWEKVEFWIRRKP